MNLQPNLFLLQRLRVLHKDHSRLQVNFKAPPQVWHKLFLTIAPIIHTCSRTTSMKSKYKSKACSLAGSIRTWRWIMNNMDYSGVHAWNSDGPSFFSYKADLYNQPLSPKATWSHSCRVNTLLVGFGGLRAAYLTDSNLYFGTYWTIFRWLVSIHFLNYAGQNSLNSSHCPAERLTSFPWRLKKWMFESGMHEHQKALLPRCGWSRTTAAHRRATRLSVLLMPRASSWHLFCPCMLPHQCLENLRAG